MRLTAALRLLRPKQWTKNLFVFAALIFTKQLTDPAALKLTLIAFAALCLASSAVYVVNDLLDVEKDRRHPVKKKRPIASGEVSKAVAIGLAVVCLGGGLAVASLVNVWLLYGVGAYLLLQVAYFAGLKRMPIIDVFSIAAGFVLRAALGAVAIQAGISGWLLFCTLVLALLIGFGKRRSEFLLMGESVSDTRPTLQGYTLNLLDSAVVMCATLAALSYGVYAIQSNTATAYPALILTTPVVLFGVFRYLYLIFAKGEGGEPESIVLGDIQMVVTLVLFIATAYLALSGIELPFITTHIQN